MLCRKLFKHVLFVMFFMVDERKVALSLRVPKTVDDFFQLVCVKTIVIGGRSVTIRKSKTDLYLQAIEYALENAEDWLKSKES